MKKDIVILLKEENDRLENAIHRVRELHKPYEDNTCAGCIELDDDYVLINRKYPCPTIKALDGEQ